MGCRIELCYMWQNISKFRTYVLGTCVIISGFLFASCGDDNDGPNPNNPPTTETIIVKAEPVDIVAIADCGGFKIKFTENVDYFYLIMLNEDVAATVSDAELEDALSNKDLSNRRLPDENLIYSISSTTYGQNYIIYTKAYTSDGIGGEIIATPYSTPKFYENESSVTLSYNWAGKNEITFQPNNFTSCYYVQVLNIKDYGGKSKGELIWNFYHEILANPTAYKKLGDSELDIEAIKDSDNPMVWILVWPQGIDGKLSPWVNINEFDALSKRFLS